MTENIISFDEINNNINEYYLIKNIFKHIEKYCKFCKKRNFNSNSIFLCDKCITKLYTISKTKRRKIKFYYERVIPKFNFTYKKIDLSSRRFCINCKELKNQGKIALFKKKYICYNCIKDLQIYICDNYGVFCNLP